MGADYVILIANPKLRRVMLFAKSGDVLGSPFQMIFKRTKRFVERYPLADDQHYEGRRRMMLERARDRDYKRMIRLEEREHRYFRSDVRGVEPLMHPIGEFTLGECSFLKASLTGNLDDYVPDVIQQFNSLIDPKLDGEMFIIDEELVEACRNMKYTEHYCYDTQETLALADWLERYIGQKAYIELW